MLTIQARATGREDALLPDWQLTLASGDGRPTLRELIERVAREGDDGRTLRALTGGDDLALGSELAAAVAVQAFQDGLYLVLVDGRRQRDLDAPVDVGAGATLTFLRLGASGSGAWR